MRITISKETDAHVRAHACDTYPDECCGVVIERAGREEVTRIRNVQDEQHTTDPERFPRTARTAYFMDPRELWQAIKDVDEKTARIRAFYHSHPDHDAYFSEEDKRQAIMIDEPSYPDAAWIVLSVVKNTHAGGLDVGVECIVQTAKAFGWDGQRRDFVEIDLVIHP